jgi:branched-chain amino acid transport system substrate-binding protein
VLGEFAVGKLGAKNIAIIDDRSAYGQGLADEFEKAATAAGATILTREFTDTTKTDFTAILTSIKGKNPDLIFYGGMDAQAGPMMKQLKSIGLTAIYLAGDGVQSAEFLKLAADAAEGAYAASPGMPLDRVAGYEAFADKYKSKFGYEVQLYAPSAYDATKVMLEAMRQSGSTDPAKYIPELAKIHYRGLTGAISFDSRGDIVDGIISLYQVKGGKWEYVGTVGSKPEEASTVRASRETRLPAKETTDEERYAGEFWYPYYAAIQPVGPYAANCVMLKENILRTRRILRNPGHPAFSIQMEKAVERAIEQADRLGCI